MRDVKSIEGTRSDRRKRWVKTKLLYINYCPNEVKVRQFDSIVMSFKLLKWIKKKTLYFSTKHFMHILALEISSISSHVHFSEYYRFNPICCMLV